MFAALLNGQIEPFAAAFAEGEHFAARCLSADRRMRRAAFIASLEKFLDRGRDGSGGFVSRGPWASLDLVLASYIQADPMGQSTLSFALSNTKRLR